mmetsp:Transcript_4231/g.11936  ORF Transcript_4231/g.11936 Transcript_4231/m.11936 type:complete len:201 (-) Transcript_4231:482-1084(-)
MQQPVVALDDCWVRELIPAVWRCLQRKHMPPRLPAIAGNCNIEVCPARYPPLLGPVVHHDHPAVCERDGIQTRVGVVDIGQQPCRGPINALLVAHHQTKDLFLGAHSHPELAGLVQEEGWLDHGAHCVLDWANSFPVDTTVVAALNPYAPVFPCRAAFIRGANNNGAIPQLDGFILRWAHDREREGHGVFPCPASILAEL